MSIESVISPNHLILCHPLSIFSSIGVFCNESALRIRWPTYWSFSIIRMTRTFTISRHLLKLMSIESVMPSNHLILCHPLFLLPSSFPSIRVFSKESALWSGRQEYWSFSFSPSNEYSGLISFRIDWFDLLAVQGTV